MTLKLKFISNKPRENAGATSSSRFNYQKDWSICELINIHKSGKDYLLLFDYHEDLVIADSSIQPKKVSFYQIKGDKSKSWTIDRLLKSQNDKDGNPLLSILGKLYNCKCEFDVETESLNFVSNSRFNVKLRDNSSGSSKDEISLRELSDSDLNKIKDKLIAELKLQAEPNFKDVLFLKVISLSLDDSATHTKGVLNDFFDFICPESNVSITAIYNHLFNEVKRLTDYNKDLTSFEELVEKKGIDRAKFDKWLKSLTGGKDLKKIWREIQFKLDQNNVDFPTQQQLKIAFTSYELKSKDPNNLLLKNFVSEVIEIFNNLNNSGQFKGKNYLECVELAYNEYNKVATNHFFDKLFVKAVLFAETYE